MKNAPSSSTASSARVDKSSPEKVFDAIIAGIQTGNLVPGQRLAEADLTETLGVSRGPVREALKRLAAEGVVTLNQNRGAVVRILNRQEADDLLRVLEVTCALGANLATRRLRSSSIKHDFAAACDLLLSFETREDSQAFIEARRLFYEVLFAASGNIQLQRMIPLMQIHLLRLQFQTRISSSDRKKQFDEYRAVIAAIEDGEARRAARMMAIHIRCTRLSIARLSDDAFRIGIDRI